MLTGDIGDYKVTYVKSDSSIIYAKMFDAIEPALDFAHKLPNRWILAKRAGQSGPDYAWKVLPYGAYKSYRVLASVDSARYLIIGFALVIAVFLLTKLFKNKILTAPMALPGM